MESLLTTAQHLWPLIVGTAGAIGLVVADDHRRRSFTNRSEGTTTDRRGIRTSFAIAAPSSLAVLGSVTGFAALYLF